MLHGAICPSVQLHMVHLNNNDMIYDIHHFYGHRIDLEYDISSNRGRIFIYCPALVLSLLSWTGEQSMLKQTAVRMKPSSGQAVKKVSCMCALPSGKHYIYCMRSCKIAK